MMRPLSLKAEDGAAVDASVDRHEIDALLCVVFDNFKEIVDRDVLELFFEIADGVVHWHSADHRCGFFDKLGAEFHRLAVVGKVHDGVGAKFQRRFNLLPFFRVVVGITTYPEVHVDLRRQAFADAFGREALVVDVGRDADRPFGDAFAQHIHIDVFFFGNRFHLRGNDPHAGGFHLGMISHCICSLLTPNVRRHEKCLTLVRHLVDRLYFPTVALSTSGTVEIF